MTTTHQNHDHACPSSEPPAPQSGESPSLPGRGAASEHFYRDGGETCPQCGKVAPPFDAGRTRCLPCFRKFLFQMGGAH